MVEYKLKFNDNLIMQIESQRAISGDFHQYVYFWDCVKLERFESVEHARDFIFNKLGATEESMVKIEEVKG